jgi:3-(3-hydroxy-phenyl)propionate hydroxylase
VDPQDVLDRGDLEFWSAMGARFVQVRRSRCADYSHSKSASGTTCVQDVDNALADWFAQHPGNIVILRPDRYVAAQFEPSRSADITRRFRAFAIAA